MLVTLYKTYLYTITAKFRQKRILKNPKALLTLAGLLVLPVLIVLQTRDMFRLWLSIPELGADFLHQFVAAALFGMFFVLILTGIPVVLHHYFLASDLNLLGVLPIPKRDIYSFKLLTSSTSNLGLFIALALPLLIGLAFAQSATIATFVVVLVASLLFIPIPTGVSVLLSLLLAQFVNVKKMRRMATLFLGLFFIAAWGGLQFYRFSRLNPGSIEFDPSAVDQFSSLSQNLSNGFLPSDWLLYAVVHSVQGNSLAVLLNLALLAVTSIVLLLMTSMWRARLDSHEIQSVPSPQQKELKLPQQISPAGARFFWGILAKDIRILRRDTRFLQSQLLLLAMLLVWPFLQEAQPVNAQETLSLVEPYIGLLFIGMLAGLMLARQNFAMEQLAFVYVKLAPIKWRGWMIAKAARVAFAVTVLLILAVFITAARVETPTLWAVLFAGVGCSSVLSAVFLGQTAAAFATRFDWIDPRYMVDMGWSYLFLFGTLLINTVGLAVVVLGFYLSLPIVAFVVYLLYIGFVLWASIRISERRLNTLQWTF